MLNMIYKQMSITTKASFSSLQQISIELDAAARDLGANKFLVMKDVILPNMKQAFATGFINNFTSAMVTAGAVIFLVTPGQKITVFTLFDCINTGRYGRSINDCNIYYCYYNYCKCDIFNTCCLERKKKTCI